MAYLKPQAPLKDTQGNYIYPLTTADQVVVEGGGRLNTVLLPSVAFEDNGKFLRVVNGQWATADIQNAEEVSV